MLAREYAFTYTHRFVLLVEGFSEHSRAVFLCAWCPLEYFVIRVTKNVQHLKLNYLQHLIIRLFR